MSYMKQLAERLDEIIADPDVPYEELRERLQEFVKEETRRSYWNGVKFASDGRPKLNGARSGRSEKVEVSRD